MSSLDVSSSFPDWVHDAIFYQVFPDRFRNGDPTNDPPDKEPWGNPPTRSNFFGGDLQGIIDELDYLQKMGVTALYLNPIFRASTNHRYDTNDYLEVDPHLGSAVTLKELVQKLHDRGMRVILDGVFNHCGEGFRPFQDVVTNGENSPYADWFLVKSFPIETDPPSYYTYYKDPHLPKLNVKNSGVREYIIQVATYWMTEAGIDGWRLDVPFKIPLEFWREFRDAIKAVNSRAYLVGEVWRDAIPWIQGDTFDGVTNYRLRDLVLAYCAEGNLDAEDFAFEVETLQRLHGNAAPAMFNLLGSHDTPRIATFFKGETNRVLVAMAFLMTTVGVPLIYYGDEIGMHGDTDPDCRRTMVWDQSLWNMAIHNTCRDLALLRASHRALRRGRQETLLTFDKAYAYKRCHEDDEVIVVLNAGSAVSKLSVPTNSGRRVWTDLVKGNDIAAVDGTLKVEIVPANSYAVFIPSTVD